VLQHLPTLTAKQELSAMIFINNKYTKWYYQIIDSAKQNPPTGYKERHHIIPRCMGGSDDHDNLVDLTARQHFVCHLLLTKMVNSEPYLSKLKYAAILLYSVNGFKISSRLYESLKTNIKQTPDWIKKRTRHLKGRTSPTKGMVPWNKGLTKETSEAVRRSAKQPKGQIPWNKGIPKSDEEKEKIRATMKQKDFVHMRTYVQCKHCKFESTQSAITRYHNDNCKHRPYQASTI
jgi:hypothetical protein